MSSQALRSSNYSDNCGMNSFVVERWLVNNAAQEGTSKQVHTVHHSTETHQQIKRLRRKVPIVYLREVEVHAHRRHTHFVQSLPVSFAGRTRRRRHTGVMDVIICSNSSIEFLLPSSTPTWVNQYTFTESIDRGILHA